MFIVGLIGCLEFNYKMSVIVLGFLWCKNDNVECNKKIEENMSILKLIFDYYDIL